MTRRRFYAPPAAFSFDKKTVELSTDEARHARDVLRLQRGDEVFVFDGKGKEFRCAVREFTRAAGVLDLHEEVEPARPESPLHLTLAVALLKPEKFDLVVQKATELGASRVIPVVTARADVCIRSAEEARRKTRRWQRIAREAAKQCGRARLLEFQDPIAFESLIGWATQDGELRLMFAERNGASLAKLAEDSQPNPARVIALIGSEGGWTDDEIARARGAGWKIVTLRGRTLRAETAAIVAAALLQHCFGDLV